MALPLVAARRIDRLDWRGAGAATSALLAAALPKCPLCLAALFGGYGASWLMSLPSLRPVALLLAAGPLFLCAWRFSRTNHGLPFGVGLLGFGLILVSEMRLAPTPWLQTGTLCLMVASVWSSGAEFRQRR